MPSSLREKSSDSSNRFLEIELDENEIEEALREGREKKFYKLRRIAYNRKLTETPMIRTYTARELKDIYALQFDIDESNERIVDQLCKYFSGDQSFNGDLSKGLCLAGGVGVGKTSMMDFFKKNQRSSFRVISCRQVEDHFSKEGNLDYFSVNYDIPVNSDPFGHQSIGYCFDDLGTESNGKNFGREKNIMAEVLLNRYDNKLEYIHTHITTNLTAAEITAQYGTRVTDRLRQMVNVITFSPESATRRKV